MGMMGTGPAAGVAQTALQAQQAARQRDAQYHTRAQQAQRLKRAMQARLKAQDEDETGADATDVQVDGQMSQHDPEPALHVLEYQRDPDQQPPQPGAEPQAQSNPESDAEHPTDRASQADPPPRRRLDVEA